MDSIRVDPVRFAYLGLGSEDRPTLSEWIRRPEARISQISAVLIENPVHGVLETLETELKYAGYIAQQDRQVARLKDSERRHIPQGFSFTDIPGLSSEVQQKLSRVRPNTLGQAGRIPGVTPAAIAVLDVYLDLAV
jgi:tRNA uridine 5-carboxymethylaminomethyl modification enzyme